MLLVEIIFMPIKYCYMVHDIFIITFLVIVTPFNYSNTIHFIFWVEIITVVTSFVIVKLYNWAEIRDIIWTYRYRYQSIGLWDIWHLLIAVVESLKKRASNNPTLHERNHQNSSKVAHSAAGGEDLINQV